MFTLEIEKSTTWVYSISSEGIIKTFLWQHSSIYLWLTKLHSTENGKGGKKQTSPKFPNRELQQVVASRGHQVSLTTIRAISVLTS